MNHKISLFLYPPKGDRMLISDLRYSSQQPHHFGLIEVFITERRSPWVELNNWTVCGLPLWAKRRGYRFICKMLLTPWSSLCDKWRLRSCTKIIIKAAMLKCCKPQASLKTALFWWVVTAEIPKFSYPLLQNPDQSNSLSCGFHLNEQSEWGFLQAEVVPIRLTSLKKIMGRFPRFAIHVN